MNLLHIDSSILGPNSVSRSLTADIVATELKLHPDLNVTYRDLASEPIGHLSGAYLAAGQGIVPESDEVLRDIDSGQAALDEFLAADIIVIGAPMYNFTVPSQLKSWIDRIAVAGKTFRYSEKGAEGLAGGKRLIIVSTRGGYYGSDTPLASLDHQENYLRGLFSFLGITEISFIRAEGIAVSPEERTRSIEAARSEILALEA